MSPEALYGELGRLIESMPNFETTSASPTTKAWAGQAYALAMQVCDQDDLKNLKGHINQLGWDPLENGPRIADMLYRAIAIAQIAAPTPVRGAFIPAGNIFDALASFARILEAATNNLLLVPRVLET
jgi:hypothetical protein